MFVLKAVFKFANQIEMMMVICEFLMNRKYLKCIFSAHMGESFDYIVAYVFCILSGSARDRRTKKKQ